MDPFSASASVITVLAAAGGSCKFLYAFVLDITDAPQDIRKQNEILECLSHTLMDLSQVCDKIPEKFCSGPGLPGWIARFNTEVSSTRDKIKVKVASLDRSRHFRRIQCKFRWTTFDRHLRKFYASLEHWNIVFSQGYAALQLTLLLNIQRDITSFSSIPPEQKIFCTPKSNHNPTEYISLIEKMKFAPVDQGLLTALPLHVDDMNAIANCLKSRSIAQRMYPLATAAVERIRMKTHQFQYVKGHISVSVGSGSITTRNHVTDGQPRLNFKGYTRLVTFQDTGWMFRRLVFQLRCYYGYPPLPDSDFRFRLWFPRIIIPQSPWYYAVQNGDVLALSQWLQSRKVSISDVTVQGDTLLHLAVRHGQREVVDFLIQNGADVNATNDWGETPLHASIQQAEDLKCTRSLLTAGADIFIEDVGGQTPLHAYYNDITRCIFQYCLDEIDLWTQDSQGMTAMHYFCWSSRTPTDLLSRIQFEESHSITSPCRSSCFELKDYSGRSMLHFATQRGNLELMRLLLSHPRAQKLMEPDYLGRSLLHYAVETSRVSAIDMLLEYNLSLDARDKEGRTLMHQAAMKSSLASIKHLEHLGASKQLKVRDISKRTPMDLALAYRSRTVVEYFQKSLPKESSQDYGNLTMTRDLFSDPSQPPRWSSRFEVHMLKTSLLFATFVLGFLSFLLIFQLKW